MTSTARTSVARSITSAALAAVMVAGIGLSLPAEASAAPKRAKTITRKQILNRAQHWVKRRVPYSQSRYHAGYRQDCSGFVSMAWQMGTSYTTRSLPSVARRIPRWKARPGDAVLAPGHVTIFAGWKNKAKRQYIAYEEPTWGKVARRRVRTMPSNARILRRPGIREARKVVARRPAATPVRTPAPAPVASTPTTDAPVASNPVASPTVSVTQF